MKHLKTFETYHRLNEFAQQEIGWLKNYLSMTDEEKEKDLTYSMEYEIGNFLESYDGDLTEEEQEIADALEEGEMESYDAVEKFREMNSEILKDFGEWCRTEGVDKLIEIDPAEVPSWYYLEYIGIVKNDWLVHFTSNEAANAIERNGFQRGVSQVDKLGLTTMLGNFEREDTGYDFAFYADRTNDWENYGSGYGDSPLIFKASGVETYHTTDEFTQIIFWGPSAKQINRIIQDNNDLWGFESKVTGEMLVKLDTMEDAITWFEDHYDQYRKHLH